MAFSTFDAFKHMHDVKDMVNIEGESLLTLQRILVGILMDIDSVCKDLGIEYMLGGGSCLGAIRHGGFIPWDDDLDINMTREDYKRFVQAFARRFGDKYWLHDLYRKDDYELCFPRIRLKGTVLRNRDDFNENECGIPVDIFLIENVPNNIALRKLHGLVSMMLGFVYSCRRFAAHKKYYMELTGMDAGVRITFMIKILLGRLLAIKPVHSYALLWDKWNGICKNSKSQYLTIPVGRKHYFGELSRRSQVFPVSLSSFESLELPIPRDSDDYMRRLYNDYMTIPAEEDRETHLVYEFDSGEE